MGEVCASIVAFAQAADGSSNRQHDGAAFLLSSKLAFLECSAALLSAHSSSGPETLRFGPGPAGELPSRLGIPCVA